MDRSVDETQEIIRVFKTAESEDKAKTTLEKLKQSVTGIKTSFPIRKKILAEDVTLLHMAAYNGWNKVIDEQLVPEHFRDVNFCLDSERRNPLHYAVCSGQEKTVKLLVEEKKCSASSTSEDGSTPLHFSSYFGNLEILKYLIKQLTPGMHEPINQEGHSPLHLACMNGHKDVAQYLIGKLGYKKDHTNVRYGASPLHLASLHGRLNIVRYLIENMGCIPNCLTNEDNTPLHLACINGHHKVVEYLLKRKDVEVFAVNKFAITPDEYAFDRDDVLRLFSEKSKSRKKQKRRISADLTFRTGEPPSKVAKDESSEAIGSRRKDLDLSTALQLLRDNDFTNAFCLGINLKIRRSKLNQLQENHGVNDLYQVLDYWFRQNPESPWQELAEAVERCDDRRTALEIEKEATKSGCPLIKTLEKGMKLEANDRQFPYYVCMATIKDKKGDKVTIHFDGWSDDYDYTCSVDSVELHPVGWCEENYWRLDKPSISTITDADWKKHPDGADKSYFHSDQLKGQHCLCFSKDMIVEVSESGAKDAHIGIITDVEDGYIKLHLEGKSNDDEWYPQDSADIHPPKWCKRHGVAMLEAPKAHMINETFYWAKYFKDKPHLIPAPAHIFTEEQW